jgi:hypothetical protein
MNLRRIEENGKPVVILQSEEPLIVDAQSALDLMATARYETGSSRIVIPKSAVSEEFFTLSNGIAGEILQKFVNYRFMLAIVGDYSTYASKPLRDFIYESNKGHHIFFLETEEEAIKKLVGI